MSLKKKSKLGFLAVLASFLIVGLSAKSTFAEETDTPETTDGNDDQSQTENQEEAAVVYDIETKEQTKRRTYRFVVTDGEDFDIWDEQVIKNGGTLLDPATPVKEGYRFAGWVDESDNPIDFTATVNDIETDNEVQLVYAKFDRIFVVTFLRELMDEWTVYRQESGVEGETVATDVEFAVKSDEALLGWAESEGATEPSYKLDDTIVFSEETGKFVYELYPVIAKVKWLTFESNGGTEVMPVAVKPGDSANMTLGGAAMPEPTRDGYTFKGWYEDEGLSTAFDTNAAITDDKTLYAKWEAKNVKYQIYIYKEDESESETGDYHVIKTIERTAKAGTEQTHSEASIRQLVGDFTDKDYYEYDADKSETTVTVEGDGSAILKVYYTRKAYTIEFDFNANTTWYSNYEMTINGTTYRNTRGAQAPSFTAKLGQDISSLWPTEIKNASNFEGWRGPKSSASGSQGTLNVTKRVNLTKDMIYNTDNSRKTVYSAEYGGNVVVNVEYYLENAEDEGYSLSTELSQNNVRVSGGTFSAKNIEGFTVDASNGHQSSYSNYRNGSTLKFYYKRDKFSLTFNDENNQQIKTEELKHGADISGKDFTPEAPEGMEFVGWFMESERLNEFDFSGATMPKNSLMLFAKFEPKTFTVSFDMNGGEGEIEDESAKYGELAKKPTSDPTRDGYEFAGWTLEDGTPFNFEKTPVTEDLVLVAKWIDIKDKYTVVYLDEDGTTELTTDKKQYIEGAEAVVAEYENLEKVFIGWLLNGETLLPNETFEILKALADAENMIKLVAQYGEEIEKASITYFANDGTETSVSEEEVVENNHDYEIRENEFVRDGFQFKEWNTKADGSGKSYEAGEMLALSLGDTNELYAIWDEESFVIYMAGDEELEETATGATEGTEGLVGETTTVAENGFSMETYQFVGWIDEEGNMVEAGSEIELVSGGRILTATWAPIYGGLIYDCNYEGCEDFMVDGGRITTETTIMTVQPTREGYNFLGWATDPEATVPDTTYDPGKTFVFVEGETVLYAVWEEVKADDGQGGVTEEESEAKPVELKAPNTGVNGSPETSYGFEELGAFLMIVAAATACGIIYTHEQKVRR